MKPISFPSSAYSVLLHKYSCFFVFVNCIRYRALSSKRIEAEWSSLMSDNLLNLSHTQLSGATITMCQSLLSNINITEYSISCELKKIIQCYFQLLAFEVLTAVRMTVLLFWVWTPCRLVSWYQCFSDETMFLQNVGNYLSLLVVKTQHSTISKCLLLVGKNLILGWGSYIYIPGSLIPHLDCKE
jgi:hypothetical protein